MTRETKVGLVVASSFLSMVGVVVAARMSRPPEDAQKVTPPVVISEAPDKEKPTAKPAPTAAKPQKPNGAHQDETSEPPKSNEEGPATGVTTAIFATPGKLGLSGATGTPQLTMNNTSAPALDNSSASPAIKVDKETAVQPPATTKAVTNGSQVDNDEAFKDLLRSKLTGMPPPGAATGGASELAPPATTQGNAGGSISLPPPLAVDQQKSGNVETSTQTADLSGHNLFDNKSADALPAKADNVTNAMTQDKVASQGAAQKSEGISGPVMTAAEQPAKVVLNQPNKTQEGSAATFGPTNSGSPNSTIGPPPPEPSNAKPPEIVRPSPTIKAPEAIKPPPSAQQLASTGGNPSPPFPSPVQSVQPPGPPAPIGGKPEATTAPIQLPAATGASSTLPVVKDWSVENYTTQPGDRTFEDISKKKYNSDQYARALLLYNRSQNPFAPPSLSQDAPQLQPGQKIDIPPLDVLQSLEKTGMTSTPTANNSSPVSVGQPRPLLPTVGIPDNAASAPPGTMTTAVALDGKSYRVPDGGQHIYAIARDRLGDGNRWSEIWRLNAGVNPGIVPGGTVLRLP